MRKSYKKKRVYLHRSMRHVAKASYGRWLRMYRISHAKTWAAIHSKATFECVAFSSGDQCQAGVGRARSNTCLAPGGVHAQAMHGAIRPCGTPPHLCHIAPTARLDPSYDRKITLGVR